MTHRNAGYESTITKRLRRHVSSIPMIALTCGVVGLAVLPVYWMLVTATQPRAQLFVFPPPLLPRLRLSSFAGVFAETRMLQWLQNSLVVAAATVVLGLILAIPAGYALSRFAFRGKTAVAFTALVSQMLPATLLVIPIYSTYANLRLLDTVLGLILAYTTFGLPFCLWMLKGFFDEIPRDLEESAMLDGCSRMQALLLVTLPLSRPGVMATALYVFILSWEDFLFANTLMNSESKWVVSIGVHSLFREFKAVYDEISAAGLIATIPVILIFLWLQKSLVKGLVEGAMRG